MCLALNHRGNASQGWLCKSLRFWWNGGIWNFYKTLDLQSWGYSWNILDIFWLRIPPDAHCESRRTWRQTPRWMARAFALQTSQVLFQCPQPAFHLRNNVPLQMVDLALQFLICLLEMLISMNKFYQNVLYLVSKSTQKSKGQTVDPCLHVHQLGTMPLHPPLHWPHQLPSGNHRHLVPLEALLTRHQRQVCRSHPVIYIPRKGDQVVI